MQDTKKGYSIIEKIAKEKMIEDMIENLGVKALYKDDLLQETFIILLTYDEEKIQALYDRGELRYFISKLLTNQINSKTSRFYYKYRKYYSKKDDEYQHNDNGTEEDDE